ncbi:DNA recombination protein RmuC [Profundibacter sp.]|uniref:DNA recombination protein RmuC n=1 Tax=Profundibacter sp. TaxID=3101071 RepID=UPI003D0AE6D6
MFADLWLYVAVAGGAAVLLLFILLIMVVRRAGRSVKMIEPLGQQMGFLGQRVQALTDGQSQLAGGLQTVSQTQTVAQAQLMNTLEQRLAEVQANMQESLYGSSVKTTRSLTELQERLMTIDKAQENIEKLSGDVLSLQDILSNKQTRGAFGEIQLNDIVSKALPKDSYKMQFTLSNGKRADCLIDLPNPPGPIVVDSKFPLEAYEALRNASNDWEANEAAKKMRISVKAHIKAISEKYILEGETADGALMFLPSEAVYAELHANFPELVREGFDARVWIVSPTTCMATLNTMRAILKDARMREQAGAIRKTLRQLHRDVEMVVERVGKLDTHFNQARADLDGIGIAAERAGKRAARLDNFDFEELAPETDGDVPKVVPIVKPTE